MSWPITLANVIAPADDFVFQGWDPTALGGPPGCVYPTGAVFGGVFNGNIIYRLTSAQLLALPGTKVQLLPPPLTPGSAPYGTNIPKGYGSGFVIQPDMLFAQYIFGGTAYTLGNVNNAFQLEYTGQSTALITVAANGLVTAGVSTLTNNLPIVAGPNIPQSQAINLGLELTLVGTTPALTLGNGSVILTLSYSLIVLQ